MQEGYVKEVGKLKELRIGDADGDVIVDDVYADQIEALSPSNYFSQGEILKKRTSGWNFDYRTFNK